MFQQFNAKWIIVPFGFVLFLLVLISCNNKNEAKKKVVSADSVSFSNKTLHSANSITGSDTSRFESNTSRDKEWLLIPGVSAGQTKIGEDADSIHARLGKPDGGDAAMMKAVAIWYSHHDTTGNSIAIYTQRDTDSGAVARVLQIRITSPLFKTREGIGTTSSLSDIQKVFAVKKTEQYADAGKKYDVYDSMKGIGFEIDAKQASCVAIVIHKVGTIGEGTYLKFRTTNKFINRR